MKELALKRLTNLFTVKSIVTILIQAAALV